MQNESYKFKSDFLTALQSRGYIHQCSDPEGLDAYAQTDTPTAYVGYDLTAPSLHVGNLISIMMLRKLQQAGGKPIIILGGGTTKIGDPSGKDESRKLLSPEQIAENRSKIADSFSRFITFGDGPTDAIMVDNDSWLSDLNYISFLRDYGRHFSINRMLTFDSVKLRLEREQPLSFIEFNYMILQAYDFVELYKRYNCRLQMGGSDQWGNIVNGIELGRRTAEADLYALTTHLLTTSSGAKMGKTAQGAIWLHPDLLSPYDYWQFWRNTEDPDVGRFLRLFTELPLDEINRLEALEGAELNSAKVVLATEATRLIHGDAAAQAAHETAHATFGDAARSDNLPSITLKTADIDGMGLLDSLVQIGFAQSNGEARRLVQGGGARVNDQAIQDPQHRLSAADLIDGAIKISAGKKRHGLIKAE